MFRRRTKRTQDSIGKIQMLDGLGDPPKVHKAKFGERLRAARRAAQAAKDAADTGRCERAITELLHAHEAFGEARAHMPRSVRPSALTDAMQDMREAAHSSLRACIIPKPKPKRR